MPCHHRHVLGHLGINVPDLDRARRYYGRVLPLLGFETFLDADDQFAYRPAGGKRGTYLFVYPATEAADYSRHRPGLQHLAFMVPTRSAVDAAHALALELGSPVVHAPQHFPQYPPPYYATFWLDPFGFMLEAVCHHDRA
jgi:catechol 2,3-dioxygenase-like lactoylglutathione lyase family enzyme